MVADRRSCDVGNGTDHCVCRNEKFYDETLGGECSLKSAKLSVDGQTVSKMFEIEVPTSGEYYLNAWVMGVNTKEGIQSLKVCVDKPDQTVGNLVPSETGWQSAKLVSSSDKDVAMSLLLEAGTHTIIFLTEVPYVPQIEFIRLAKDETNAAISDQEYRGFFDRIKAAALPSDYATLKNSLAGNDSTSNRLYKVLPNPDGDYAHDVDVTFYYTYYTLLYFYAGAQVVLETKMDDPYASDPVMEFFNADDPINKGSWADDDGGQGYQSKITCTVQYSGYYYVLLWSWRLGSSGTTNLYLYDNLYASNVPLTHTGLRSDHTPTEVLNYFTCRLTGDSRIWIEDQNGFPGLIRAYNDDYYGGGGDFNWGLASRVKAQLPMAIRSIQYFSYSSYNPTGTCDVYMKCGNSDIMPAFENLKADDAIRSAPASGLYNCISWSGGIYWDWVWPPWDWPWSDGYSTPPLTAFDNYYSNKNYLGQPYPRYSGAWNYTRNGATSTNNQVDLWSIGGDYTHASVNSRWSDLSNGLPANGMPHGYDWESKPGGLTRTFHPRDGLRGSAYGNIDKYYRWDGTYAGSGNLLALNPDGGAVLQKAGLSTQFTIEKVELTETEVSRLDSLTVNIPGQIKQEFNAKYNMWKKTWQDPVIVVQSDPRKYVESAQYEDFLKYCKENGKTVWPLLFSNFVQGSYFDFIPIRKLSYSEYRYLLDSLNSQYDSPRYTSEGVYIVPSTRSFRIHYIEKLLSLPDSTWGQTLEPFQENLGKSTSTTTEKFSLQQNYPNPFNPSTQIRYSIPSENRVSLKIYNVLGQEIAVLVNNEVMSAGYHTVAWNGRDKAGNQVASGIYLCRLISGTHVQSIKLVLTR